MKLSGVKIHHTGLTSVKVRVLNTIETVIVITDSEFSHTCNALDIRGALAGTFAGSRIEGNYIHDLGTYCGAGFDGDGINLIGRYWHWLL